MFGSSGQIFDYFFLFIEIFNWWYKLEIVNFFFICNIQKEEEVMKDLWCLYKSVKIVSLMDN